jgi:hypothetical protein
MPGVSQCALTITTYRKVGCLLTIACKSPDNIPLRNERNIESSFHRTKWYPGHKRAMNRLLTALVIGNAAYRDAGKLKNPSNDADDIADDIAARLEAFGFSVIKKTDCAPCNMVERT